jgi:hypothetical protein
MEKPSTNEFEKLIATIAKTLDALKIPYYLTGGAAVVTWGKPRFTADVDIVVELFAKDIKPLAAAFRRELSEGAHVDEEQMRTEQERAGEFNIVEPTLGLKADFFISPGGPEQELRLQRVRTETIADVPVRFISPEDLILAKLAWYRESGEISTRHREDAESIVAVQGDNLDMEYLRKSAARLGVADALTRMMKNRKDDK